MVDDEHSKRTIEQYCNDMHASTAGVFKHSLICEHAILRDYRMSENNIGLFDAKAALRKLCYVPTTLTLNLVCVEVNIIAWYKLGDPEWMPRPNESQVNNMVRIFTYLRDTEQLNG